jgi:signal transduction histidine kinase
VNAPEGFRASWLSKLSHDLRNQLSPVRTATQLLQSGRLEPERQAEMLEMIERQVQRMVRMLDDMAEYGRLRAQSPKRENLHIDYVIDSALGECGQRLRGAGHVFELHLPETRLPIVGDRGRLVQMFLRLLDNAIRFTPDGGSIVVSVQSREGFAETSIRDSGAGLERDRLERIFHLPEGPRASDGLGISLLLARACAEEHGGSIEARSAGPGKGSEFFVRLPLAA